MTAIPDARDVNAPLHDDNGGMDMAPRRWRTMASRRAPTAGVGVLGLAAVVETLAGSTDVHPGGAEAPGLLILLSLVALATTLPLALPRPTAAGATVIAAGVLSLATFHALTVAGVVAQVAAGYRIGRRGRPAVAALAAVPFLLIAAAPAWGAGSGGQSTRPFAGHPLTVATATGSTGTRGTGVLLAALVPALALAGAARRLRHEDVANQATRQAIAGTLLEHTARGERARIARELHDVVAHHISMVAVQAETARLTTPGMPAAGAQRLSAIGDTARAALTEMRRLLGVLREDARYDGGGRPDLRPQPGLRQLADLLDEVRDATGNGIRLILRGRPVALEPGVELAAYRIVQEALTNARRHAPGAAVDVELHYTGDALRLLIRDNGPGSAVPVRPGRHGLLGMRERAAAVGGHLDAGAGATGGFLVAARFPRRPEDGP